MKFKINNMKKKKRVFGTTEWASFNYNMINGCTHNCKYCFAKSMAIRFKRKTSETWAEEELNEDAITKHCKKKDGIVMFPTTHDITPKFLPEILLVLNKLLFAGNKLLIVSKPHLLCIKEICTKFEKYKSQILFRFTIGSTNNDILKFYEPGAPSFEERLECLQYAYNNGFKTSISSEPMLDDNVSALIDLTLPFITDAIWLGKANSLIQRMRMNGIIEDEKLRKAQVLSDWQKNDANILIIYEKYKNNTKIKFKESIKKVAGIELPNEIGLDI